MQCPEGLAKSLIWCDNLINLLIFCFNNENKKSEKRGHRKNLGN